MCSTCEYPILSHHRTFIFWHSPTDIEFAQVCGGVPAEWRPHLEQANIPGDDGPDRVGYFHHGESMVQVHAGLDEGMWKPCFSYTVPRDGIPYCMWMCRRGEIEHPCDEEFMREIGS